MEILPALAQAPLFWGMEPVELRPLLADARLRRYPKGASVLRAGERTADLGLVLSGAAHVLREDFWGNRTIVGRVEAGDVFAESFALAGEVLEVSVQAASELETVFLNAAACDRSPRLTANLLSLLAGKNLALTRKMGHMARRTTREKLLSYLSAQALRAGGPIFTIPLDRQQLADFLAVDRSAMSATLGKLRDEGILEFHKNQFRLLRDRTQTL